MPIKKLLLLIHRYSQQLPCTTGPFAHRCNSYSFPPRSFLSPSQNRPVESQLCVYADLYFCTHLLPSFPVSSQVDDLRNGSNFSFPGWVGLPPRRGAHPSFALWTPFNCASADPCQAALLPATLSHYEHNVCGSLISP